MTIVLAFFELYIIPFILALGLIFLLHGIVNYFILGPGDEGRKEAGRQSLLRALVFCFFGFIIFGLLYGAQIALRAADSVRETTGDIREESGVRVEDEDAILRVPNTPNTR